MPQISCEVKIAINQEAIPFLLSTTPEKRQHHLHFIHVAHTLSEVKRPAQGLTGTLRPRLKFSLTPGPSPFPPTGGRTTASPPRPWLKFKHNSPHDEARDTQLRGFPRTAWVSDCAAVPSQPTRLVLASDLVCQMLRQDGAAGLW